MKKHMKKESGELMIESMIVLTITMLMIVWVLGVGFVYYQKYAVRIATNDVAKKVAATYDAPSSDIIMGYISMGDIKLKKVYSSNADHETNRARSESYVKYILSKANLFGTVEDANVSLEHKKDALGRSHVAVTTECTFNTPFGVFLQLFGIPAKQTYRVTSYADSTSLTEYVSTVTMADTLTDGTLLGGTGFIDKTIKMINSFMGTYDQLTK